MSRGKKDVPQFPGFLVVPFVHELHPKHPYLRRQIRWDCGQVAEVQLLNLLLPGGSGQIILYQRDFIRCEQIRLFEKLHYFCDALVLWVDHFSSSLLFFYVISM